MNSLDIQSIGKVTAPLTLWLGAANSVKNSANNTRQGYAHHRCTSNRRVNYLCGSHLGISANIPAMPLHDAHFGGFFTSKSTQAPVNSGKLLFNNTPQAYPAVRCSDAQTGGLIISGAGHAL